MSGLHHFQRHACEQATRNAQSIATHCAPLNVDTLRTAEIHFTDGSPAYFAGVSTDEGPCADPTRQGENYAIFSLYPVDKPYLVHGAEKRVCTAALLVRTPSAEALNADYLARVDRVARMCVEVVTITSVTDGSIQAEKTGITALYTRTTF